MLIETAQSRELMSEAKIPLVSSTAQPQPSADSNGVLLSVESQVMLRAVTSALAHNALLLRDAVSAVRSPEDAFHGKRLSCLRGYGINAPKNDCCSEMLCALFMCIGGFRCLVAPCLPCKAYQASQEPGIGPVTVVLVDRSTLEVAIIQRPGPMIDTDSIAVSSCCSCSTAVTKRDYDWKHVRPCSQAQFVRTLLAADHDTLITFAHAKAVLEATDAGLEILMTKWATCFNSVQQFLI